MMTRHTAFALLALLSMSPVTIVSGQEGTTSPRRMNPAIWGAMRGGYSEVGYRRLAATPPVDLWYPATPSAGGGRRLAFGDYAGSTRAELSAFLQRAGLSAAAVDSVLTEPMAAIADAPAKAGPFPLVLIAQGNGQDALDQAVLCEYLASHGYVVASRSSPMTRSPMSSVTQTAAFAEQQADELLAAVPIAAAAVRVLNAPVFVIGHSFGARSALLMAMRDRRIAGIISLDGGIGTSTAIAETRQAPSFRPDAPLPMILHFYEELDAFMTPDFTFLRSLRTRALVLEPTRAMRHVHFSTFGFAAGRFPALAQLTRGSDSTATEMARVAERTLQALVARSGLGTTPAEK